MLDPAETFWVELQKFKDGQVVSNEIWKYVGLGLLQPNLEHLL